MRKRLMRSIEHVKGNGYWNDRHIQPGVSGTLGDVNVNMRLRSSAPDLPMRYDPDFSGKKAWAFGGNVQNGQSLSYTSHGGPARVYDSNWQSGRSFKTNIGEYVENLMQENTDIEPHLGSLGTYTWSNKVANVYSALRTGENFLPYGPYALAPGEVPRAPSVRVTAISAGEKAVGDGRSNDEMDNRRIDARGRYFQ